MIRFVFKEPEDLIYDIDGYFDNSRHDGFVMDPYCKRFIEDIDKVKAIDENVVISKVLGAIDARRLSGGVKELMYAYKTDKLVNGNNLGENCIPWLIDIARNKDITVHFNWIPDTLEGLTFDGVCLDSQMPICNFAQFVDEFCIFHGFAEREDEHESVD